MVTLGTLPFATSPAASPVKMATRSLDDLLANGWTTEAQAVLLVHRVMDGPDPRVTLRKFLDSKLPPLAKLFASAGSASGAAPRRDASLGMEGAQKLVAQLEALSAAAGGVTR